MSFFKQLTGSDFGALRDDLQQGFRGGSFSKGGKAAINAFDPLISKERMVNNMNHGLGGGDVFSSQTMSDQGDLANTAGQVYSLYALGSYGKDMFGGGNSSPGGMNSGGMGMGNGMGGMGGGGGQQTQRNDTSMRLQQETADYMKKKQEEEQIKRLAEALRS